MEKVTVQVGDQVMVTEQRRAARLMQVTKAGRVWIDVRPMLLGFRGEQVFGAPIRFRLDTQADGSKFGNPRRFYTMEQWERHGKVSRSQDFLRAQGITIERTSHWRSDENIIRLADAVRDLLPGNSTES